MIDDIRKKVSKWPEIPTADQDQWRRAVIEQIGNLIDASLDYRNDVMELLQEIERLDSQLERQDILLEAIHRETNAHDWETFYKVAKMVAVEREAEQNA